MIRAGSGWRRAGLTGGLLGVPVLFVAVFLGYPVATMIDLGLRPDGAIDVAAFRDVLGRDATKAVAWFTLWQAIVSTLVTAAVGLPVAWVLGRFRFPGHRLFAAALVVPFVLPTVVVGTAFLGVVGPDGPLDRVASAFGAGVDLRRTTWAVVAAHVFFNVAVVARTVGAAWAAMGDGAAEAARTLGCGPLARLRFVLIPMLAPALGSACAIVFLFSFTSFGVVKILGGPGVATIEVEIHRVTTQLLDLRTAAVLSLLQIVAVVAALVVVRRVARPRTAGTATVRARRSPAPGRERRAVLAIVASTVVALGLPLATLVWRSFAVDGGIGLAHYRNLGRLRTGSTAFVDPVDAIANSLRSGAVAAALALVVGTAGALGLGRLRRARGPADAALMLPLGVSAVTVGFGFLVALDEPPLDLRTSPVLVPIAQALVAAPFVIRAVLPAIDALPRSGRDAARTLGCRPWQVARHVDAPLLRRPLLVAAGFAYAIALGEFGATVFVARPASETVPVAIFRSLSQPGSANVGRAMALSTILMVLTTAVIVVTDRLADDDRIGGSW